MKLFQHDNIGEKKKLQAQHDQAAWKLNIHFEYTVKNKSQQNYLSELGFMIIAPRTRVIMSHAILNQKSCLLLCKAAIQTATKLDKLTNHQD